MVGGVVSGGGPAAAVVKDHVDSTAGVPALSVTPVVRVIVYAVELAKLEDGSITTFLGSRESI